jgi:hypothetical protein
MRPAGGKAGGFVLSAGARRFIEETPSPNDINDGALISKYPFGERPRARDKDPQSR